MEKQVIADEARKITNREGVLVLLNKIKRNEMECDGLADKYKPFTMGQMMYYCNPAHTNGRYKQFQIKKKTGGFRQISAPRTKSFKMMLRCVNEILKALYTPSDYAMGFTDGRCVVDNAQKHIGQNYVFNTDIKDFFPSIVQQRVWGRLQAKPFCFPKEVANLFAGLCSMWTEEIQENGKHKCVLPQGAPTSPIITNMICDKLDWRLAGLAKRFGLSYSRYADDITFSSMHNVYQHSSEFRKELKRIIEGQGFKMNEKKTRLQQRGERQEVTGVTVNTKPNVPQKYVRDIRNILYIWRTYGYNVAYGRFLKKYKADKGHVKKGSPDMINVVTGKLDYLKMVKGNDDAVYVRLRNSFEELIAISSAPERTNERGITFVETMPLLQFEKLHNATIVFNVNTNKTDKTTCHKTKADDKDSKAKGTNTERYATFTIDGKKMWASISKRLSDKQLENKDILAISHCRDKKNAPFWLIHHVNKNTSFPVNPVDVDELNRDLDELLNL